MRCRCVAARARPRGGGAGEMQSAPRRKEKYHQARAYRRLLRPQKDLRAFFGPFMGVLALSGVVLLGLVAHTVGRQGVMPEFETRAVIPRPCAVRVRWHGSAAALCRCPRCPRCLPPARSRLGPLRRARAPSPPSHTVVCPGVLLQGDPKYSLLHTEDTYWKLASSMGGFPIKHFYTGGHSVVRGSDGQALRQVEEGVGAGGGALVQQGQEHRHSWMHVQIPKYGKGLHTADLEARQHTWLSQRVSKIREYFDLGGGGTPPRHAARGMQLAHFGGPERANRLVKDKLRVLRNQIEAEALGPRSASREGARPGLVVTHSLPALP